ncbi:hypothetical protein QFZ28_006028 [Neobacillus niacini]|uniref:hypothetical protein n=1 Tax=Neobacillus niacini TaxID=86668 RepID=UPI0027894886|nr:hypothetical protein [Neobacillus niacini]MDQ1005450.1 hypothetical protein [Neobacillus niacini]
MVKDDGIISQTANTLADKIYEGIKFFFETKIDLLVDILPELTGLALLVCGLIMMFGDLRKWLSRSCMVVVLGTTLVVLL